MVQETSLSYSTVSVTCAFSSCLSALSLLFWLCGVIVRLCPCRHLVVVVLVVRHCPCCPLLSSLSIIVCGCLWLSSSLYSSSLVFVPWSPLLLLLLSIPLLSVSVSSHPIVFVAMALLLFRHCTLPIFAVPVARFHPASSCS